MLASLRTCFGCGKALGHELATPDGFCHECLERSRTASREELGGEA